MSLTSFLGLRAACRRPHRLKEQTGVITHVIVATEGIVTTMTMIGLTTWAHWASWLLGWLGCLAWLADWLAGWLARGARVDWDGCLGGLAALAGGTGRAAPRK